MTLLHEAARAAAHTWLYRYRDLQDEASIIRRLAVILLAPIFFLFATAFFYAVLARRDP